MKLIALSLSSYITTGTWSENLSQFKVLTLIQIQVLVVVLLK